MNIRRRRVRQRDRVPAVSGHRFRRAAGDAPTDGRETPMPGALQTCESAAIDLNCTAPLPAPGT